MSAVAEEVNAPEHFYQSLMARRQGHPVEETLARIIASWYVGNGAMPVWLGLGAQDFAQMLEAHFPGTDAGIFRGLGEGVDAERGDEMQDLHRLLTENLTTGNQSEQWMVEIVIAGCLGNDHLWQDLGLWNRGDLSRLMRENFEALALRNNKDMKWKKFLYKQLCETEGIYTCRAPSCEVCNDYQVCFGPEE